MVFLGLLFNKEEAEEIAKKSRNGILQNQVNAFQWNCIEGLYENGADLHIINGLPVGTYPKQYSDAVIPSKEWTYNGGTHFQLGSLNLPLLKQWGRFRACKKLLGQLKDKEILIYSTYQPFLKAVKNLDKSYKVTLIVPDLPAYYDYAKVSGFRKMLRKINNRSIEKCMSRVDRFVLLTEHMKEPLGVGERPYTVVEGICASKPSGYGRTAIDGKKIVLYTGSLNKQFGIDVLLEGFEKIPNEDYELWVCGGGDYQEFVKAASEHDSRIKFYGYVSKEKIMELQSKATVLVNPRQNTGEYTKYSFPSKTLEYLLSGVPVVAYKLDGIPSEYEPYFCFPEDNSADALSEAIKKVCEDKSSWYSLTAEKAVDFVLTEKNPRKQAKKILELMDLTQSEIV